MGTFTCDCGNLIRDSSYPNPCAGNLYWQPAEEAASERFLQATRDLLAASANGTRTQWMLTHLGSDYPGGDSDDADVIDDLRTAAYLDVGQPFYQCPVCNRLYLRLMEYDNTWARFDPKA